MMTCPICKHGELRAGTSSVTLERNQLTLVIKGVPARVCDNCPEAFIDESISRELLAQATAASDEGIQVEVRQFAA